MRGKEEFRPYVGVTGFMSLMEVESVLTALPQNPSRDLMVGILMSSKTLRGETNSWPSRYPKKDAVAGIFPNHPNTLNLIHYNTDTPERLVKELYDLTEIGGENLDGFQVNVAWPNPAHIEAYLDGNLNAKIVLRIGRRAMELVGNSPIELAKKVNEYQGLVDAILLDPSGGKGEMLKINTAKSYLASLCIRSPFFHLGIAGGLCATTVPNLRTLILQFNLSTDAQRQLRTPQPEDALRVDEAIDYVSMTLIEATP